MEGNGVIGIVREVKNRWERRVPFTPEQVEEIIRMGMKVLIQPSQTRCYSDYRYEQVGAIVQEDISEAAVIFGVKEIPKENLLPNKTYVFFSHTIKAQDYNMPMLDDILRKNIRLMDYEKITDTEGARLVKFGPFAGIAGAIDILHGLGERLFALGYSTPFLYVSKARKYPSLEEAKDAISKVGELMKKSAIPKDLCPLVFTVTSRGSVAQGALSILQLLPHYILDAKDLPSLKERAEQTKIYICIVSTPDYVVPNDPSVTFTKPEYYANPENYTSKFHELILPYTNVLVNCMYWEPRFPRIITNEQALEAIQNDKFPLIAIADITCDIQGTIEFFVDSTSIEDPFYIYNLERDEIYRDTFFGKGVLFLGVDHLPAELPFEASEFFGKNMLPFVKQLTYSNGTLKFEDQKDLPPELYRSVIACHGELTPDFKYINDLRQEREKSIHKILIIGSGNVAAPVIHHLGERAKYRVTVASNDLEQVNELTRDLPGVRMENLNVNDSVQLKRLVENSNLVISIVPAVFHLQIAKICLECGVHLLTASYMSPELRALHEEVKKKDLVFLMETGLDPGLDHMTSMKIIREAKENGYNIRSYKSYCGGLPAPDHALNPFGYKFSWYPKGVLIAAMQPAKYLVDGEIKTTEGGHAYDPENVKRIDFYPAFNLQGVPARDSTFYTKLYGIEDSVHTMIRGTIRYPPFFQILRGFMFLGLVSEKSVHEICKDVDVEKHNNWKCLMSNLHCKRSDAGRKEIKSCIRQELESFGEEACDKIVTAMEYLGMFSEAEEINPKSTLIDCVSDLMAKKMAYGKNERDVILMQHEFVLEKEGEKPIVRRSKMLGTGDPKGYSAMSFTVGMPLAVAAKLIVTGRVKTRGVCIPSTPDIYEPILLKMSRTHVVFEEEDEIVD